MFKRFYQTHWDPLEAWSVQLCESWSHPSQSDNRQSSSPHTVICASLYPWCCSRNKVAQGGGWIKHDALAQFQWPVWSAVIQISTPDVQLQVVFKVGFHPRLCLFHRLWEMLLSEAICLFTHVLFTVFIINQSLKYKKKSHSKSTKHSCLCGAVEDFPPGTAILPADRNMWQLFPGVCAEVGRRIEDIGGWGDEVMLQFWVQVFTFHLGFTGWHRLRLPPEKTWRERLLWSVYRPLNWSLLEWRRWFHSSSYF